MVCVCVCVGMVCVVYIYLFLSHLQQSLTEFDVMAFHVLSSLLLLKLHEYITFTGCQCGLRGISIGKELLGGEVTMYSGLQHPSSFHVCDGNAVQKV